MLRAVLGLTSLVVSINQLSAEKCKGGVFCIPEKIPDLCGEKDTDVCTTLVLYNSTGHKFQLSGSGNLEGPDSGLGLKNIVKAQQVGMSGCYTLYKRPNQRKEQFKIKDIGSTHDLQAEGVGTTIFRSIKYEQSCPREAGLPWWGIVLPLVAVILLGAGIFIIYKRKRQH